MTFGIIFDIDGVFVLNKHLIPNSHKALVGLDVPHVFLTNGTGVTEAEKASGMSELLEVPIKPEQVILACTPMSDLDLADKHVLMVARNVKDCHKFAKAYGWHHVIAIQDYVRDRPWLYPARSQIYKEQKANMEEAVDDGDPPFDAIVVMETPADWGESLQIVCDVIRSPSAKAPGSRRVNGDILPMVPPPKLTEQKVALHFSNPDFEYAGECAVARHTLGAFRACLDTLYKLNTGLDLQYTLYGKPYEPAYDFAHKALVEQQCFKNSSDLVTSMKELSHIYVIGDNPKSDILGCINAQANKFCWKETPTDIAHNLTWKSVLVETGCFHSTPEMPNDPKYPADHVCSNVNDAVRWIHEDFSRYNAKKNTC